MTTPKELADKAKQQAEVNRMVSRDVPVACDMNAQEYGEHLRTRDALHTTINQLQAMAEARQGSGEPVAVGGGHAAYMQWLGGIDEEEILRRAADRLKDAADSLEHCDEDGFVAALRNSQTDLEAWADLILLRDGDNPPSPPSAQQATGSGQVLTDEQIRAAIDADYIGDAGDWSASAQVVTVAEVMRVVRHFAAATQAQPEVLTDEVPQHIRAFAKTLKDRFAIGTKYIDQPVGVMCETDSECERYIAALTQRPAAPTTGKREREWLSMESAPKGPTILLWWRTCSTPSTGRFVEDERGQGWVCDGDRVIPKNQQDCTHWQPLPPAPAAAPKVDGCSDPRPRGITGEQR